MHINIILISAHIFRNNLCSIDFQTKLYKYFSLFNFHYMWYTNFLQLSLNVNSFSFSHSKPYDTVSSSVQVRFSFNTYKMHTAEMSCNIKKHQINFIHDQIFHVQIWKSWFQSKSLQTHVIIRNSEEALKIIKCFVCYTEIKMELTAILCFSPPDSTSSQSATASHPPSRDSK